MLMQKNAAPPVVLVVAGNDPSGGAGLAADIQAITALGAYPAPVVAALTVQDPVDVYRVEAVDAALVVEQARRVLENMPVAAIKLGLLATSTVGTAVADLLARYSHLPLVVDPVVWAGGGAPLVEETLIEVYRRRLFPVATLVTPNAAESRRLAAAGGGLAACAEEFLASGTQHVLIKGADEDTPEVHNTLFSRDRGHQDFRWPRLPGTYHGSGCTLASAIAALLACGQSLPSAVEAAQRYTWRTLRDGWQLSAGQRIPNRQPRL